MRSTLFKEAWDKKTIELGGSILQSFQWGEFSQSMGQKIHRFVGDDFTCLCVEVELMIGRKYVYCPRGPVGNVENALTDLRKFADDRSIIFTRLEPHHETNLPKAIKDVQPPINWVLSLDKTQEEILIGMKPKTRYNINLAQRKGVIIKEGSQADLLEFYKLMLETASRNQFKLHPQSYYFHMWDYLASENLKLLLAYYQDQLLAGMLLSFYGDTATYLHGGSSEKLKDTMAPYLLHWEAIKSAKGRNMKMYDFGGVAPVDAKDHSWAGISRFKKGFGGFEVKYPGAYDIIYSPIWYNVYSQGRKLRQTIFR